MGEWQTNSEIDCGDEFCGLPVQDVGISHVIVHPGYHKQTYQHNIALLILRNKINYTGALFLDLFKSLFYYLFFIVVAVTAQPICLPEPWSVTNNNGILVGWGKAAGQRGKSTFLV